VHSREEKEKKTFQRNGVCSLRGNDGCKGHRNKSGRNGTRVCAKGVEGIEGRKRKGLIVGYRGWGFK